jgi:hypothetical protein
MLNRPLTETLPLVLPVRSTSWLSAVFRPSALPEKNCFVPANGWPRSVVTDLSGSVTTTACGFLLLYSSGPSWTTFFWPALTEA